METMRASTTPLAAPSTLKPPSASSLEDLIAQLHGAFSSDRIDVDWVHELMESYRSNPAEWGRFAKFDRYKYTRNLVDEGNGKFNLMLLCWGASHASSIHDHADAHCFMKVLDGALEEVRYEWPEKKEAQEEEGTMVEVGRSGLPLNGVCYINDSLGLHRVSNPSDSDVAVSLHLYCPPFSSCQVFDQNTGKKMTSNVTFHSKFGQKVKYDIKKN